MAARSTRICPIGMARNTKWNCLRKSGDGQLTLASKAIRKMHEMQLQNRLLGEGPLLASL
jgi:hypothetical protein